MQTSSEDIGHQSSDRICLLEASGRRYEESIRMIKQSWGTIAAIQARSGEDAGSLALVDQVMLADPSKIPDILRSGSKKKQASLAEQYPDNSPNVQGVGGTTSTTVICQKTPNGGTELFIAAVGDSPAYISWTYQNKRYFQKITDDDNLASLREIARLAASFSEGEGIFPAYPTRQETTMQYKELLSQHEQALADYRSGNKKKQNQAKRYFQEMARRRLDGYALVTRDYGNYIFDGDTTGQNHISHEPTIYHITLPPECHGVVVDITTDGVMEDKVKLLKNPSLEEKHVLVKPIDGSDDQLHARLIVDAIPLGKIAIAEVDDGHFARFDREKTGRVGAQMASDAAKKTPGYIRTTATELSTTVGQTYRPADEEINFESPALLDSPTRPVTDHLPIIRSSHPVVMEQQQLEKRGFLKKLWGGVCTGVGALLCFTPLILVGIALVVAGAALAVSGSRDSSAARQKERQWKEAEERKKRSIPASMQSPLTQEPTVVASPAVLLAGAGLSTGREIMPSTPLGAQAAPGGTNEKKAEKVEDNREARLPSESMPPPPRLRLSSKQKEEEAKIRRAAYQEEKTVDVIRGLQALKKTGEQEQFILNLNRDVLMDIDIRRVYSCLNEDAKKTFLNRRKNQGLDDALFLDRENFLRWFSADTTSQRDRIRALSDERLNLKRIGLLEMGGLWHKAEVLVIEDQGVFKAFARKQLGEKKNLASQASEQCREAVSPEPAAEEERACWPHV